MKEPITSAMLEEQASALLDVLDKLDRANAIKRLSVELRDVFLDGMKEAILLSLK